MHNEQQAGQNILTHLWQKIPIQEKSYSLATSPKNSKSRSQSIGSFLKFLHCRSQSIQDLSLSSQSSVVSIHDITYSEDPPLYKIHDRSAILLKMLLQMIKQLQECMKNEILEIKQQFDFMFLLMRQNMEKMINSYERQLIQKDSQIKMLKEKLFNQGRIQNEEIEENYDKSFEEIKFMQKIRWETDQSESETASINRDIYSNKQNNESHLPYTIITGKKQTSQTKNTVKKRFRRTKELQMSGQHHQNLVQQSKIHYLTPRNVFNLGSIIMNKSPCNSTQNSVAEELSSNYGQNQVFKRNEVSIISKENWFKSQNSKKKSQNFVNEELKNFFEQNPSKTHREKKGYNNFSQKQ